jgi:uncharacterized protein (TIGR02594 family)
MVELLFAFRRLRHVIALAIFSVVIVASVSPASARSHRHHDVQVHHRHLHHARMHHAVRHHHVRYHRHVARSSRIMRTAWRSPRNGFDNSRFAYISGSQPNAASAMSRGFGGNSTIVSEARRYLGGNPTGRGSLWCARFMNMVLQHTGHRGTGSDMASSFAHYGQRVSGPQVGAIAVMARRGGGHVGIITGLDARGNPIMISGNNGNRVREAPVSRGRIYAYVMPN